MLQFTKTNQKLMPIENQNIFHKNKTNHQIKKSIKNEFSLTLCNLCHQPTKGPYTCQKFLTEHIQNNKITKKNGK